MRKYDPLTRHLVANVNLTFRLPFASIESLIGSSLPESARRRQQWWANDATHVQTQAWIAGGFRANVDLAREIVEFQRIRTEDREARLS